ncbi:MAG: conserved phage C-terminal domain-containing protein, partial [Longicatena sp.]
IVGYLNEVAGSSFRSSTESTKKHINARLTEKFTVDDFKTVIDKKVKEWQGTEFAKYIRPETLFGSKFESYLNQPNVESQKISTQNNNCQKTIDDKLKEAQERERVRNTQATQDDSIDIF